MTRHALVLASLLAALVATSGCLGDDEPMTALVIDFPAGHDDVDTRVRMVDVRERGAASAHNQLLAWSAATGTPVDIEDFSFGACLNAIDGIPASPGGCHTGAAGYWSLALNGEVAASGMDEVLLAAGDTVTWTYTPLEASSSSSSSSSGPLLSVEPAAPTRNETLTLTGTVDRDSRVSVTGAVPIEAKAGAWTVEVPLEPGRTQLLVTADDGQGTSQAGAIGVRLVSATFEARFTMAFPPREPIRDLVWYDPDEQASAPAYAAVGAEHAGIATVHDLMVTWERQSGKAIGYTETMSFESFGVESIDGVGQPLTSDAPPWWCYKLNDATADFGISLQAIAPGDVVTWEFAGCA